MAKYRKPDHHWSEPYIGAFFVFAAIAAFLLWIKSTH